MSIEWIAGENQLENQTQHLEGGRALLGKPTEVAKLALRKAAILGRAEVDLPFGEVDF